MCRQNSIAHKIIRLCALSDAVCAGKPFNDEVIKQMDCDGAAVHKKDANNAYLNGTVCIGLCDGPARSLASTCKDGAWQQLDGSCQQAAEGGM